MLRRSTKFQLILFVVITLLGISYVGAEYIGLTKYISNDGCKITADFRDSGGIFSNAEVTYRGVTVGRVGALNLIKNGVRVDLDLDNCSSPKIPADSGATVANRSVVGEQYVNLVPTAAGKASTGWVRAGSNLPMSRNKIPVATETLLTNLDDLVRSVNLNNLRTTVDELGKAVSGRGNDLGTLLDASNSLLTTADETQNVDATIKLIQDSAPVLQTQLDEHDPLRSWAHSLNLLSAQLKKSDPDIRHLFDTGPADLATIRSFIKDNQTDFGVVLANLATTGQLLVNHLGGLEQVLELYPALAAGGQTLLTGNQGRLGLIVQTQPDPEDCGDPTKDSEGYNGTVRRQPNNTSAIAPNVTVRCTASASGANAKNVRGSAHVPGGDPISESGGGYAYPRATTKNTLAVGNSLSSSGKLSDASWLALLTDGLN
ncbi:MCE family protein [uncultured Jatrophihabitans sp.]|uniref:MCE family protein n=1 Tax=uncultured Jatrophihabitans sp. TaxID=1610747 RepID=UPI0035CC727D